MPLSKDNTATVAADTSKQAHSGKRARSPAMHGVPTGTKRAKNAVATVDIIPGIQDATASVIVDTTPCAQTIDADDGEKIPPAVVKETTSNVSTGPVSEFNGRFKFYSMSNIVENGLEIIPFPSYEEIYDHLAESKPSVSLKCAFTADDLELSEGYIRGPDVVDPFFKQPLKFNIAGVEPQASLSFTEDETMDLIERDESLDPVGPGAIILLELADVRRCPSIYGATGSMKIIRAWSGTNADGKSLEVYEAYLEYEAKVDPKAYRKVTGNYQASYRDVCCYWAIKADEDEDGSDESDSERGCGGGYYNY